MNYDFFSALENEGSPNRTVYHYTTPDAFTNIVGDTYIKLRFSRAECLNDYSEGKSVLHSYKEVLNELLAEELITNDVYRQAIELSPLMTNNTAVLPDESSNEMDIMPIEYDVYVCAFSTHGDSLPLWNYYIYNNQYYGYSIGLDLMQLQKNERYWRIHTFPIIYDREEINLLIRNMVLDCIGSNQDEGLKGGQERDIMAMLTKWQYQFKDHHSAHENEIRAILFFPKEEVLLLESEQINVPMIKYRTKNGILIPYIDISFDKSALKEIVIAPTLSTRETNGENSIELKMTKEYIQRMRYSNNEVSVSCSTVPARY